MKIHGRLEQVSGQKLSPAHTQVLARSIMNDKQAAEFDATNECNFAISLPGVSRYRISAYVQRSSVAMVVRAITAEIPAFESLHLPPVLKEIAMTKRGMVIFVGATGSGKSTSLAAMIDYRNRNSHDHIITIEDPIEFVHEHQGCIVTALRFSDRSMNSCERRSSGKKLIIRSMAWLALLACRVARHRWPVSAKAMA